MARCPVTGQPVDLLHWQSHGQPGCSLLGECVLLLIASPPTFTGGSPPHVTNHHHQCQVLLDSRVSDLGSPQVGLLDLAPGSPPVSSTWEHAFLGPQDSTGHTFDSRLRKKQLCQLPASLPTRFQQVDVSIAVSPHPASCLISCSSTCELSIFLVELRSPCVSASV